MYNGFLSLLIVYLGVYLPTIESKSFPDRHLLKDFPTEGALKLQLVPKENTTPLIFRPPAVEYVLGDKSVVRKKRDKFASLSRDKRESDLSDFIGINYIKDLGAGVVNRMSTFVQLGKRIKRSGDEYPLQTAISNIQDAFQKFITNSSTSLQNSFKTFMTKVQDIADKFMIDWLSPILESFINELQVHLENMLNDIDEMKKSLSKVKDISPNVSRRRRRRSPDTMRNHTHNLVGMLEFIQTLKKTAIGNKVSEDDKRHPRNRSRRSPDETVVEDHNIVGMKSFRQDLNDAQIGDGTVSEDDTRLPRKRSHPSPDETVVEDHNIVGMKSFRQYLNDVQIGDILEKPVAEAQEPQPAQWTTATSTATK